MKPKGIPPFETLAHDGPDRGDGRPVWLPHDLLGPFTGSDRTAILDRLPAPGRGGERRRNVRMGHWLAEVERLLGRVASATDEPQAFLDEVMPVVAAATSRFGIDPDRIEPYRPIDHAERNIAEEGAASPPGMTLLTDLQAAVAERLRLALRARDSQVGHEAAGRALHTVSDFYAQSNFVELANARAGDRAGLDASPPGGMPRDEARGRYDIWLPVAPPVDAVLEIEVLAQLLEPGYGDVLDEVATVFSRHSAALGGEPTAGLPITKHAASHPLHGDARIAAAHVSRAMWDELRRAWAAPLVEPGVHLAGTGLEDLLARSIAHPFDLVDAADPPRALYPSADPGFEATAPPPPEAADPADVENAVEVGGTSIDDDEGDEHDVELESGRAEAGSIVSADPGIPASPVASPPARVLRRGMHGGDVALLQLALSRWCVANHGCGHLPPSGTFGARTQRLVRHIQRTAGLPPSGIVDTATGRAIG